MRKIIALFVCLAAFPSLSFTQVVTGTILGSVTDPSGGAVSGAQVSIVNLDTNVRTQLTTNSEGQYTRPYLPPGRYEVDIAANGFAAFRQPAINLAMAAQTRVDARLTLASASQQ